MGRRDVFTRGLALVGAVLAWAPMLATILIAIIGSWQARTPRLDWMMPAEFFPSAALGGLLLVWASLRARLRRGAIAWSLVAEVALLVASQGVAVLTGLAHGETEPGGWEWVLVLVLFAAFIAAQIAVAVGGVLLTRDLGSPEPL